MNTGKPTILVMFGITGDLAGRYILPAIVELAGKNALPTDFHLVGLTRQPNVTVQSVLEKVADAKYLESRTSVRQIDVGQAEEYRQLCTYLGDIENKFNEQAQILFYLSVPPEAVRQIISFLGTEMPSCKERISLLLEKPFGTNLSDARELADHIDSYFKPQQIYRVDHYLAKEAAQNIPALREDESLKKVWSKDFIERIEILASEEIGIEGRSVLYEQIGAFRDFIQNHLIELLALVLMKLPLGGEQDIPSARLAALRHLWVQNIPSVLAHARRAQYQGYREEVRNPLSRVETFASIDLQSDDNTWAGVPMALTTGKRLERKFTEIRIFFKKEVGAPEDMVITFGSSAYKDVLAGAIHSDHHLFVLGEEVLESWRIFQPVLDAWAQDTQQPVVYTKGTKMENIAEQLKAQS